MEMPETTNHNPADPLISLFNMKLKFPEWLCTASLFLECNTVDEIPFHSFVLVEEHLLRIFGKSEIFIENKL